MEVEEQTRPQIETSLRRRAIVAAAIGNFVEWFDYAVYAYLATILAVVFFPSENETASLLATFAVFAVAFFMRPLGAVVCGHFGDRIGRQRTLAAVILMMSAATFCIGLLPPYSSIGLLAPVLLVLLRLVQGFSAGGEYSGATSYVTEYAGESHRGYLSSWLQVTVVSGLLFGSALSALLSFSFSDETLNSWAWRLPFLVAGPLGIVGLYLRLKLEDTPKFRGLEQAEAVARSPLGEMLWSRDSWRRILLVSGIALVQAVAFYILLTYLPTYLTTQLGFSRGTALLSLSIAMAVLIVLIPPMGALSDRLGRKPLLIGGCVGFLLLVFPAFLIMSRGGIFNATLAQVMLAVPAAAYSGTIATTLAELFSTRLRYSGVGIGYNLSVAAFGGTAPFVATFLTAASGNSFAPGFYLMATAVLSLAVVAFIKETAKEPLR